MTTTARCVMCGDIATHLSRPKIDVNAYPKGNAPDLEHPNESGNPVCATCDPPMTEAPPTAT